ncbi:MAG TPA: hypothetical protein VLW54_11065 [Candidatus Acidoferrales bacterium]|nr:hypothetical protein [Candidatus Acidoferrales bacterium]
MADFPRRIFTPLVISGSTATRAIRDHLSIWLKKNGLVDGCSVASQPPAQLPHACAPLPLESEERSEPKMKAHWPLVVASLLLAPCAFPQSSASPQPSAAQATAAASQAASASAGRNGVQASGSASQNANAAAGKSGQQGADNFSQNANASVSGNGAHASSSAASSSGASGNPGKNSASLANGTTVQAELSHTLDSKKCKPGDPVYAKATQDVKSEGHTVIPKGSKLVGHVTRVRARQKGESQSSLGLVFDRAVLKNGQQVPFHAVIQTLAQSSSAAALSGGGDDLFASSGAMGGGGAAAGGGGRPMSGGGGLLGGVPATAGGAVGGVTNTAAGVTGPAGSTVNSTVNGTASTATRGAGSTLAASGALSSSSSGVFGLNGIALQSVSSSAAEGSLILSQSKYVRLDSGTRMLLRAEPQEQ